jgi:hypothetical protein
MRKKQAWVYYCDFCKKSGRSGGHMKRHEAGCTANPNRVCSAHCKLTEYAAPRAPLTELVALLKGVDTKAELAALREAADDCPMCILAAIRQSRRQVIPDPDEDGMATCCLYDYDFRAELKSKWSDYNQAYEQEHDYGVY